MQTIVCMKWGTRYPADFVNRLYSMVMRNTVRQTRFICFTEDPTGLSDGIITAPLPDINIPERVAWTPWRKLSLWRADLGKDVPGGIEGDALFLDLDMVITGPLDDFFDFAPGAYCVIENFTQRGKGIGNTSLFRFPVGPHAHIFDVFNADPESVLAKYRIEQQYISGEIEGQRFWPDLWCASFKHDLMPRWPLNFVQVPALPSETRVVAFTGKPDPDEALIGEYPVEKAWKKIYKHVRPTPWIGEHWR